MIYKLALDVVRYAEHHCTTPLAESKKEPDPFRELFEFWKVPLKRPLRLLSTGFRTVSVPLVKWLLSFVAMNLILGFLLPPDGVNQARVPQWSVTLMLFGTSFLVSGLATPSTYVAAGVTHGNIQAVMKFLETAGVRSEAAADALEKEVADLREIANSRISKLRWGLGAVYAGALFLLQKLFEATPDALSNPRSLFTLVGISAFATLGVILVQMVVESYATGSLIVFRTVPLAITELRARISDPEQYLAIDTMNRVRAADRPSPTKFLKGMFDARTPVTVRESPNAPTPRDRRKKSSRAPATDGMES